MIVEIVSPEALLFKGEATALTVPGAKGTFQLLENHAPIISILNAGEVVWVTADKKTHAQPIKGGTLEFKDNKAIILAD